MKHLTMTELERLGFEIEKSYTYDEWMTQRRVKNCLTIETTWKKTGEFEIQEVQIDDGEWRELKPSDIVKLDKILNG